jgi:hypothetical protein
VVVLKKRLFCALLISATCIAAAQPVPPHIVYGEIREGGESSSGEKVTAVHSGSELGSTTSGPEGNYTLEIPYDSSYRGEQVSLELNSTGETGSIVFEAGETSRRDLVDGYIRNSTGQRAEDVSVAFLDGDTREASDSTDDEGFYSLEIPFSGNSDGTTLDMSVGGQEVGENLDFVPGGETQLNYTGEEADSSDQSSTEGGEPEQPSEDDTTGSSNRSEDADGSPNNDSQTRSGSGEGGGSPEQGGSGTGDLLDVRPNISTTGLGVQETATQGERFRLEVSFENTGDARGVATKDILVDGDTASSIEAEVPPDTSVSAIREISLNETGERTISVAERTTEIKIEPNSTAVSGRSDGDGFPNLPLILMGTSALLLVLAGIYYLYSIRSRTAQGEDEQEEEEDPKNEYTGIDGDPRTQNHDYDLKYADDED